MTNGLPELHRGGNSYDVRVTYYEVRHDLFAAVVDNQDIDEFYIVAPEVRISTAASSDRLDIAVPKATLLKAVTDFGVMLQTHLRSRPIVFERKLATAEINKRPDQP